MKTSVTNSLCVMLLGAMLGGCGSDGAATGTGGITGNSGGAGVTPGTGGITSNSGGVGVTPGTGGVPGGAGAGGGGSGAAGGNGAPAVTFWQDVAPIYNQKCVTCHQPGGLGPFPLDNYADALSNAVDELARTASDEMPPYFMVHDGSCGSFQAAADLTAAEKATIAAWVNGGRAEGTPVTLTLPSMPALADAVDVATPLFSPVAQGGGAGRERRVSLLLAGSAEHQQSLLDRLRRDAWRAEHHPPRHRVRRRSAGARLGRHDQRRHHQEPG